MLSKQMSKNISKITKTVKIAWQLHYPHILTQMAQTIKRCLPTTKM